MKRLSVFVIALICISSGSVFAQGGRFGRGGGARGAISPGELQIQLDWAKAQMPNLYSLASSSKPARQRQLYQVITNHYRAYDSAVNPPVRDRLKDIYKSEDEIYGKVIELDQAVPEQKRAIRESIRQEVRNLLNKNLEERAQRIENLKKSLADEESRLAADRSQIEELLNRRLINQFGFDPVSAGPTSAPSTRPADAAPGGTLAAPPQ